MPPALIGDQTRIRQVVLNLVTNAIKFTDKGGVEISACCVDAERDRSTIECSVSDYRHWHRAGSDRQAVRRFHPGRFLDQPPVRRHRARACDLQAHRRADGRRHPRRVRRSASAPRSALRSPCRSPTSAELGGARRRRQGRFRECWRDLDRPLRVLLAEDNRHQPAGLHQADAGFQCRTDDRGRTAARRWSRPRAAPSTSCSWTCGCPRWTGWRPRARSARSAGRARIPIVALTANAFADDVKACRDAGMDEFIAKPMRKKVLVEKLARAAGRTIRCCGREGRDGRTAATSEGLPVTPPAEVAMADVGPVLDRRGARRAWPRKSTPTACARRSTCFSPTRRMARAAAEIVMQATIARGSRMRRTG